jgi:(p)ppGpp synthase/HD superfamily hydrolase
MAGLELCMTRVVHPPNKQLAIMLAMAAARHVDQFDATGEPYILHTIKVMHYLGKNATHEEQTAAIGHDLVEDTKTTFAELEEWGMSDQVISDIRILTRMPGETEEEYQTRICSNLRTIKIKKADLRHNSDIRRGKGLRQKDFDRLQKYHTFYKRLEEAEAAHIAAGTGK